MKQSECQHRKNSEDGIRDRAQGERETVSPESIHSGVKTSLKVVQFDFTHFESRKHRTEKNKKYDASCDFSK
jgi:hypothetical protein